MRVCGTSALEWRVVCLPGQTDRAPWTAGTPPVISGHRVRRWSWGRAESTLRGKTALGGPGYQGFRSHRKEVDEGPLARRTVDGRRTCPNESSTQQTLRITQFFFAILLLCSAGCANLGSYTEGGSSAEGRDDFEPPGRVSADRSRLARVTRQWRGRTANSRSQAAFLRILRLRA